MSIYGKAAVFRHIQILIGILNGIQKGPLIILLIFSSVFGGALFLTLLIKSSNADFIFYATFGFMLLNCWMISLVIFSQFAMIYKNSCRVLEFMTWKQISRMKTREVKWEQRFYKSCAPLKIVISSGEFVNALTPLNLIHFGMGLSANLLLLTE